MKARGLALIVGVLALGASSARAGSKFLTLAPGGRTVAGPGSVSLAVQAAVTVFNDPVGNNDRCATVVNTGKSTVQLTLTSGGTQSINVDGATSGSLCRGSLQTVTLTCTGTTSCTAQWRVDNQ